MRSFRPDRFAYTIVAAGHLNMLLPRSFLEKAGESARIVLGMMRKT